ncbi:Anti-sigma regulatory factor (Ser/Thr protein kinase) [Actinacidiphila alni]|uniref:Anti-sigma regulatory factor (Ser/Thr protein kinase) n=1 Tax=Actinacidiphila alni TaxID=380248 RepID=A0A1I2J658_9ACTN|nr:ATP-binding protein [Actinacidiphila alni]SFF49500.1 Anti-sigma regulatory factor (Ser/Thr protein kinase) [Actinacidiphila alni]
MHASPAHELVLWPAVRSSVPDARHQLAVILAEWKLHGLTDAASLVLSELMTNALQHARRGTLVGSEIGTVYARLADGVRIEVHDGSADRPERRAAEPGELAEGGRGLALVDALTGGRWGFGGRDGVGKVVWAEVTRGEE